MNPSTLPRKWVKATTASHIYGISSKRLRELAVADLIASKREGNNENAAYLLSVESLDAYIDSLPDA